MFKLSKIQIGLLFGVVAGIIDVMPMIMQKLTWDANLSAFSLWGISGFLISTSSLKLSGVMKGIFISVLALIPAAIIIVWSEPLSLIPISIMTIILGGGLGYFIERFGSTS